MKYQAALLYIVLFLFTSSSFAATYVVKKGDTLANIARKRYGEPVFGPKGTLKKLLKQNAGLKAGDPLEPGQKINLEMSTADYPSEKVPNAKPPPLPPEETEPASPPPAKHAAEMTPAERAAHQMDLKPRSPVAEVKPPAPPPQESTHVEPPVPPPHAAELEAEHEHTPAHAEHEGAHNYISFIPQYSMIAQTARANDTGESYTMHSSPAWGAELGWDHWWNSSFSTVLTYSALQFTSKESYANGSGKLLNTLLTNGELALLNRVAPWVRLGLGMAYGDHVFVLGFPAATEVYKIAYLNPFATAEFTAFESEKWELLFNVKVSQLPAQSETGHVLLAGTEYLGQVSLLQKFEKFAMTYGIAYSTENQTLSDARETRNEWALKIGALF